VVIFLCQKGPQAKEFGKQWHSWLTVEVQYVMAKDRYPYSFAILSLLAAAACPHHLHFLSVLFTNFSVMCDTPSQVRKAPISFVHLERPLVSLSTCISATFVKICQANPDLVEIGQKFWAVYMKTKVVFIVSSHIKLPKSSLFN